MYMPVIGMLTLQPNNEKDDSSSFLSFSNENSKIDLADFRAKLHRLYLFKICRFCVYSFVIVLKLIYYNLT